MAVRITLLIFTIVLSVSAEAQTSLCVPGAWSTPARSEPKTKFFRFDFFDHVGDLEYVPREKPYAELYVRSDQLNVRDTPNGKIVGKVFKGQTIFVYAKKGDWVSISRRDQTLWVHKSFLSYRRDGRVSSRKLEAVCSFEDMELLLAEDVITPGCKSVATYVVWNHGNDYLGSFGDYMASNDKSKVARKLAHCKYQLFQNFEYF